MPFSHPQGWRTTSRISSTLLTSWGTGPILQRAAWWWAAGSGSAPDADIGGHFSLSHAITWQTRGEWPNVPFSVAALLSVSWCWAVTCFLLGAWASLPLACGSLPWSICCGAGQEQVFSSESQHFVLIYFDFCWNFLKPINLHWYLSVIKVQFCLGFKDWLLILILAYGFRCDLNILSPKIHIC